MIEAIVLWQRLDTPGHDACALVRLGDGWRLEGAAAFWHEGAPAQLGCQVTCNRDWTSREARVRGWLGTQAVDLVLVRGPGGGWTLNGLPAPDAADHADIDLGFTPATNVLPIRRAGLAVGEAAELPAAWLDVAAGSLTVLPQRYERRGATAFWYEAPTTGYADLLETTAEGLVRRYPQLWTACE
jgi:hypothetical protein